MGTTMLARTAIQRIVSVGFITSKFVLQYMKYVFVLGDSLFMEDNLCHAKIHKIT